MKRHDSEDEMASTPSQGRTRRQNQSLPPEVLEILLPSLKVGGIAGACGLFTGAAAGIIRSAPTLFFSVITGGQWFTLSTSYYAARLVALRRYGQEREPTPTEKLKASTMAGGVAGTLGGMLRGPRNVLPGALMFSLFGAGGQAIVNWRTAKAVNNPSKPGKGFWSRWSPLTPLSDQDYEKILEERLLRVDADIAVVDDHIKELRASENQAKASSETESSSPSSQKN